MGNSYDNRQGLQTINASATRIMTDNENNARVHNTSQSIEDDQISSPNNKQASSIIHNRKMKTGGRKVRTNNPSTSNDTHQDIQVGQRALSGSDKPHLKIKEFGMRLKNNPKVRSDLS